MATINSITSGVLTQASVGGSSFPQRFTHWGRTTGQTSNQFQTFRLSTGVGQGTESGIRGQFTVGNSYVLNARDSNNNIIQSYNVRIVATRGATVPGASQGRSNVTFIDVDFDPGGSTGYTPPGGIQFTNYQFGNEATISGDITSNRNFNFESSVTLSNLISAAVLGTDNQGRIVAGTQPTISITQGIDFTTDVPSGNTIVPQRGDFHILTRDFTHQATGTFNTIMPVTDASGNPVTLASYGNPNFPNLVGQYINWTNPIFINVQISANRNDITPALGVAANPVELYYEDLDLTPGTWTLFSPTIDSSPNGNPRRIRVQEREDLVNNLGVPAPGDPLGFLTSQTTTTTTEFMSGTYIFDGSSWILINRVNDPTGNVVGDSFINSANLDTSTNVLTLGYSDSKADLTVDLSSLEEPVGITVEGNDAAGVANREYTGITSLDFNHNDFHVTIPDPTNAPNEVFISTISGAGGTIEIQDSNVSRVNESAIIDFGSGLSVTGLDDAGAAANAQDASEAVVNLSIPIVENSIESAATSSNKTRGNLASGLTTAGALTSSVSNGIATITGTGDRFYIPLNESGGAIQLSTSGNFVNLVNSDTEIGDLFRFIDVGGDYNWIIGQYGHATSNEGFVTSQTTFTFICRGYRFRSGVWDLDAEVIDINRLPDPDPTTAQAGWRIFPSAAASANPIAYRSFEFAPSGTTGTTPGTLFTSSIGSGMYQLEISSGSYNQNNPPIVQVYEYTIDAQGRPTTRSMIIPNSVTVPSQGTIRITFNQNIRGTVVLTGIRL